MKKFLHLTLLFALLCSCNHEIPMVNLGLNDFYRIARMQKLDLHPQFIGQSYLWTVNGKVVATTRDYVFMAAKQGRYNVTFQVIDDNNPFRYEFVIEITEEQDGYSPYISTVYEYCPAPGQFVNEMPKYDNGDTAEDMRRKTQECIAGRNDVLITLGSFGGYVTFGFDHTVANIPGEYDFRIWGNAFIETAAGDSRPGGSAEPGVVWVSYDENCNGLPDDEWYQLAGSEYLNPLTRHNYTISYSAPAADHEVLSADNGQISDMHYIAWLGSDGEAGWLPKNVYHTQDYFPKWITTSTIQFTGTLLPGNAEDIFGDGSTYRLYCFKWGYVDNYPNSYSEQNSFDISWAVDKTGIPVNLPGVDFIRVVSGMNQYCSWLGETSTEISCAQDLHISTGVEGM